MSAIFVHTFVLGADPFDNCMFIICITFVFGQTHVTIACLLFVHAFMLGAGPFDNCMFIICIAFILGADHTSYAGCVLNGCCGARLHAHSHCVVGATRFEHGSVVVAVVVAVIIVPQCVTGHMRIVGN